MIKKSLLDININLLPEYIDIEALNPNNWSIAAYLNLKYDMDAAIAFSKLYFPDFIQKDGCIILGFRYDEEIFKEWKKHLNGNVSHIERICNRYDIMDYFALNRNLDEPSDLYNQKIDEFAAALKKSWEINCQLLFPDRKIIVEVYDENDTTRITLYST